MNPRNKLNDKVIIDREVLQNLILYWVNSDVDSEVLNAAKQALAADLTGWAAVLVDSTDDMLIALYPRNPFVLSPSDKNGFVDCYKAMLAASPPLPGGRE